jgi:hypothetical protein
MNLLTIFAAILTVFIIAIIASAIITRLSNAGRVARVEIGDLLAGDLSPGILYEITAEVKMVDFTGLDSPSVLVLSGGGSEMQAVDPDGALGMDETAGTSLLPSDPGSMVGEEKNLGSYRVICTLEDLPVPHLKVRAARKN